MQGNLNRVPRQDPNVDLRIRARKHLSGNVQHKRLQHVRTTFGIVAKNKALANPQPVRICHLLEISLHGQSRGGLHARVEAELFELGCQAHNGEQKAQPEGRHCRWVIPEVFILRL